jgi:hypothetical protein
MIPDGTYTAVLDRFEDDLAVFVLEDDGEAVHEVVLERASLPEAGRTADAVFRLVIEDETVTGATYDADETDERAARTGRRFRRLSRRLSDRNEDAGDGS